MVDDSDRGFVVFGCQLLMEATHGFVMWLANTGANHINIVILATHASEIAPPSFLLWQVTGTIGTCYKLGRSFSRRLSVLRSAPVPKMMDDTCYKCPAERKYAIASFLKQSNISPTGSADVLTAAAEGPQL